LHGLFRADAFRAAFLAQMGVTQFGQSYDARVEGALDDLAAHIEAHMDVEGLLSLAR
jgi:adenosylcobyric acid synthase